MKKTAVLSCLAALVIFALFPCFCAAQGPGDPGCSPDDACPIDGGLSLLIAGAGALAARKAYKARKA